jgi:serine phosphatase RsbU (regulator of sigma subunit)
MPESVQEHLNLQLCKTRSKGEMFGFPKLRALIVEHAEEERPLGEFLMEELYSFVGKGWEQEDDITLLTLKRSASLS